VAKAKCAEMSLLNFLYQNIQYPMEARRNDIQGTVVLSFIVEKDGTISDLKVVKDIGGGCAEEALRVVGAMNEVGIRWTPGKLEGQMVRVRKTLPIRFRLEDPPSFTMIDGDSVYVEFETPPQYTEGQEALEQYLKENLKYPELGNDSCLVGDMDLQVLIQPDGLVKVLDVNDFNRLGFDFQFEAIRALTATFGQWTPAVFEGRPVPAALDLSVTFTPTAPDCAQRISDFEQANEWAVEASQLYNEGEKEAGLEKIGEAIQLFPDNANFLYMRGQMFLDQDRMEEACADFKKVRDVLANPFIRDLLPLICN
jgi:TonB family protein